MRSKCRTIIPGNLNLDSDSDLCDLVTFYDKFIHKESVLWQIECSSVINVK